MANIVFNDDLSGYQNTGRVGNRGRVVADVIVMTTLLNLLFHSSLVYVGFSVTAATAITVEWKILHHIT